MRKILSASVALALLGGCATQYSDVPLVTNFPTEKQRKLQAGAHWNLIAIDAAEQIKNSIPKDGPVYVMAPRKETEFNRAFHNQLITALVNKGLYVSKVYDSQALIIDIDTQLVKFSKDRFQNIYFVSATALTAGLWALHETVSRSDAGGVAALGLAAAIDAHQLLTQEFAKGGVPQREIIITTSATRNAQYVARRTDVYYTADTDSMLYRESTKTIPVRGDQS